MTYIVKGRKHRPIVLFKRRAMAGTVPPSSSSSTASYRFLNRDQQTQPSGFIVEDSSVVEAEFGQGEVYSSHRQSPHVSMSAKLARASMIPDLFTSLPPLRDLLNTQSSQVQDETIQECLPFLSGAEEDIDYNENGVPHLDRKRHIQFLHKCFKRLPAAYVAVDPSRPWFFYWVLNGLVMMGEDPAEYRDSLVSTVRPIQNASGGFGGGNGQLSHLAPTYATVLALSIVGGDVALDLIDRKALWEWLGALKQPDGGFQMSVGGEEDIRGAYCAMVLISLLNLPLKLPHGSPAWKSESDTLLTNLPEWVARCQTFEGGMSGKPDAEAHGAYAFCALGCLCILDDPHVTIPKYLDVPRLVSWLSSRQYAPEGGFAGRTNKLVDGCYSHWIGSCWPLLEACLDGQMSVQSASDIPKQNNHPVGSLYSREALLRYILCCCQDQTKRGGLRDKPSHNSDAYHTCYVLAGLSSAQHKWQHHVPGKGDAPSGGLDSAYRWTVEPIIEESQIYDEEDRVRSVHPVFAIPDGVAERTREYFGSKGGF